jgi:hypothetical protein
MVPVGGDAVFFNRNASLPKLLQFLAYRKISESAIGIYQAPIPERKTRLVPDANAAGWVAAGRWDWQSACMRAGLLRGSGA